jgi:outer membrane protein assembly factor BamB
MSIADAVGVGPNLIVSTRGGEVVSLAPDGRVIWAAQLPSGHAAIQIESIAGRRVAVVSGRTGSATVLDATTGKRLALPGFASGQAGDGFVLSEDSVGHWSTHDATTGEVWCRVDALSGAVSVDGKTVYMAESTDIAALDPRSCARRWTEPLPTGAATSFGQVMADLVAVDGQVVIRTHVGTGSATELNARAEATGKLLWTERSKYGVDVGPLTTGGSYVSGFADSGPDAYIELRSSSRAERRIRIKWDPDSELLPRVESYSAGGHNYLTEWVSHAEYDADTGHMIASLPGKILAPAGAGLLVEADGGIGLYPWGAKAARWHTPVSLSDSDQAIVTDGGFAILKKQEVLLFH